jgi:hypothetical protein
MSPTKKQKRPRPRARMESVSAPLIGPLAGCRVCRRDAICDQHAEAWIRTHRGPVVEIGVLWGYGVACGHGGSRSLGGVAKV